MINVIIAPEKGGVQPFSDITSALAWAKVSERELLIALEGLTRDKNVFSFDQIEDAWKSLRDKLSDGDVRAQHAANFTPPSGLFLKDSQTFKLIKGVYDNFGDVAARGAFVAAGVSVGPVDWKNADTSTGILIYKLGVENYLRVKSENTKISIDIELEAYNQRIEAAANSVLNMQNELASLSSTVSQSSESANQILDSLTARTEIVISEFEGRSSAFQSKYSAMLSDYSLKLADSMSASEKVIQDGKEKVDAWVKAQVEHVRLEAPVRLWEERDEKHRAAARKLGWAAFAAGGLGTVATPVMAKLSFDSARTMLADAMSVEPKKAAKPTNPLQVQAEKGAVLPAPSIRPTLHFELAFAGAATLFWLTMFFWLMRILVRRYIAEQRLAVDASGRAAMTQTYLGLIKESAASEKERPIVLGALFQPVTEGASGDDGPPATSLASIVAAIVAGKN